MAETHLVFIHTATCRRLLCCVVTSMRQVTTVSQPHRRNAVLISPSRSVLLTRQQKSFTVPFQVTTVLRSTWSHSNIRSSYLVFITNLYLHKHSSCHRELHTRHSYFIKAKPAASLARMPGASPRSSQWTRTALESYCCK